MIRHIAGPAGRLEALIDNPGALCTTGDTVSGASDGTRPEASLMLRAAVVVAHPHPLHGGTMHTKVVFQAAKAFCRLGCAVLRFNFRGTGASEGQFDEGRGEKDDFCAALDYLAAAYPGTELWAAGMSFGAWIAMTAGAEDPRVTALLGIAAPVELYDFSRVGTSGKSKFFIHGERDELCSVKDIRRFYAHAAEPKDLIIIDAADHLFDGRVSEVAEAIEGLFG
jgi:alpha/beta superfamily hydrolase